MRRLAWGIALGAAVALGACSSDGANAGNIEDKLVDQLTAGEGFDEDEARCIAVAVAEELGAERLAELYSEDPDNPPDEVQDSIREQTPACFDMGSIVESIPG